MKTSYKECNHEVAESLKHGRHINCLCKLIEKSICFETKPVRIVAYIFDPELCCGWYIDAKGNGYDVAEPVKYKTFVIDAVSMMKGLIEQEYIVNQNGLWVKDGSIPMTPAAWKYCGQPEFISYDWEPWMLEEREVR